MADGQGGIRSGARVLVLRGQFAGHEGVCLGEAASAGLWAISPDTSSEILALRFEEDFGLLASPQPEKLPDN